MEESFARFVSELHASKHAMIVGVGESVQSAVAYDSPGREPPGITLQNYIPIDDEKIGGTI